MNRLSKSRLLVTRFPFEARFGGEEKHTLDLMEGLRARGSRAFFLGSCPVLLGEFERRGFDVKRAWLCKPPVSKAWLVLFTLASPLLLMLAGGWLFWARRKWRVDTVYMLSFGEKLLMTPWALLFGMKVLWLEHARIGKWITANPWRPWYSFLSRWTKVVVTSNAMVTRLPFARNVMAISCGVLLDKPSPLPADLASFIKGGFCVGSVARLTVDKGVDTLVRLVESEPDTRLVLVGTGPLLSSVEKAAGGKAAGRIFWLPSLSRGQLTSLYTALDVFVLASRDFDPFGMVAAEAMMAGTPTVVTRECGISFDLHGEALVTGVRFAEIDKAVRKLKRDSGLRRSLGARGKRFGEKHYSLERMVGEFADLLSGL